jgi:uracil-DNA glycosylase family 4
MKIKQLFDELKAITENKESIFADSGMANYYNKMQYGFFPLGWGILDENNKIKDATPTYGIEEGGVMVLGNDFGTVNYVNDKCTGIGETNSKTIDNLLNEKVGLNRNKTFFTNFYLGARTHPNATMTKRVEELQDNYKETCYKFFLIQLNLLNPKIIICLGHDVKNALLESKESSLFINWKPKSGSIKKIHDSDYHILKINNKELGKRKFVIVPHPCDLRNFTKIHMGKLNAILKDNLV